VFVIRLVTAGVISMLEISFLTHSVNLLAFLHKSLCCLCTRHFIQYLATLSMLLLVILCVLQQGELL